MTNEFKGHIRLKLKKWHYQLRFASSRGQDERARRIRAMARGYRMGLEEVLNANVVAEIFEGYDFGGEEA